ncbi:TPA: hypothetical protein J1V71_003357 [Escherichia coli]|nr:hypothetical protein [Escherichia coli]
MATGKMDAKVCRHFAATTKEKGATLLRNHLIYLVELAGVEPASEIPTSSVLHA